MSNPSIKNYAFKAAYERNRLEDVAQALLGKGKYKHEKWYSDMSSAELLYYNKLDSELLIELLEYKDEVILKLMIIMMRLSNLTLPSIARRKISASLKGMFEQGLDIFDFYSPNYKQLNDVGIVESMNADGKFKGALVIDPITKKTQGVHFDVTCVDYNSLYPSIINTKNVCFSTLNCFHENCKTNKVPELSHHICTKNRGFISQLLGFIRDTRVYFIKPLMKENPQYSIIEQALKVFINAGYGVFSSPMFAYYCPPFGETVTAWGRHSITSLFDKVESDGVKLVYSDTDSVFIIATKEYIDGLMVWAKEELKLELGIDYVAEIMGLYRSKNYFMLIEGKFNVKGMTGQKKNAVPLVRECFENVLEISKKLTDSNLDFIRGKIIEVVRAYIDKIRFEDIDVGHFKVSTSMNRPMNKYESVGTHVRCAKMMAVDMEKKMKRRVDHNKLVPAGTTIEYVHVNNSDFRKYYKEMKMINTPALPLTIATSEMINKEKYVDVLVKTMHQLLVPFKISETDILSNQVSLEEYF
jgi:DNA polymerase I